MKVKLTPDGRPLITLGKAERQKIQAAYGPIAQLGYHGQNGCRIGHSDYFPEHFNNLAAALARLLKDAAGELTPPPQGDGAANAANSQPPTTPVAPKKGALSC